ncbi:hypothetical protein FNJ84_01705 [Paracoccus sp. M683]|uniref:hypothetical protein n=1 Tax=Paracoccus sp. M683 TaxID=2594268 RepID=UPI0011816523|nr:hypothetical protein [Paracoccus sp. M683]TRW99416.1 hypothetical protein FNJ84_01705 [Paracoccus sp. M683]
MLAMLALDRDCRRNRRWLEAHLWSDRAQEQAMGSLRQALREIRKALGPHADCLRTDRDSVSITDLVIDEDQDRQALAAGREFLEGMDVADQEFEDWLRDERMRRSNDTAPATARQVFPAERLTLMLKPVHGTDRTEGFLSHALANAIGQLVGEFVEIDTYILSSDRSVVDLPEQGYLVTVDTLAKPGVTHLLIGLSDRASGRTFWSRRASIKGNETDIIGDQEVPEIVFRAADAVCESLAGSKRTGAAELRAEFLTAKAVRSIFAFDSRSVRQADSLMSEAISLHPNPRSFAWMAYMRQVMAVERIETDWHRMRGEADEFARKAMEFPAENPLVLALVSQIRVMLDGDPDIGICLARDAMRASPHNPFCYSAVAGAQLRIDRPDRALDAARQGATIAGQSALSPWWHSLAGLSALAMRKDNLARSYFETTLARAPNFRTALRCLYFLYQSAGQPEKAERVLSRLIQLEPDFTFDRLRDDPDYPAATLRRSGLIGAPTSQG